jgi:cytidylate kinase
VAPGAALKVFLVASEEERARRRFAQDAGHQPEAGVEATRADIIRRDALDSTRAVSPLAAAPDAVVLDTTGRAVADVVKEIVDRYRQAMARSQEIEPL